MCIGIFACLSVYAPCVQSAHRDQSTVDLDSVPFHPPLIKPSMAIFQSKVRAGDEAEAEPLICECSAVL